MITTSRLRQIFVVGGIESFGVVLGGIAGLLIVNVLPKEQYAQYTFLLACMMLMLGITDLGLQHCPLPVVGQRTDEKPWVVGACHQIFRWRWVLLGAGALIVAPYWRYTSLEHGWSGPAYWSAAALMVAIVLLSLREHLSGTVVLILGHISTMNRIAAVSHAIRISLIGFVLLLPVTAWSLTGIVAATATAVLVNVILYQRALRTHGIEDSRLDRADRKRVDQQVVTIARPLVLSAIFFQFQGVITVFLVSLFGTADMLAEVGAFGRLAVVLMVADRITNTLLFPALARAPVGPRLAWMVTRVHAVYLGMMLLVLLSAWFGAHWWILLLGEKYRSVEPYVWMVFMASILLNASSLAFRTLTVRGLTAKQAYIIPVILAVQILYLWLVGVTDLRSVLNLNIATCLAHFAYQYTLLGLRMSQMREQA